MLSVSCVQSVFPGSAALALSWAATLDTSAGAVPLLVLAAGSMSARWLLCSQSLFELQTSNQQSSAIVISVWTNL